MLFFLAIQWPVNSTTKNCGITYVQQINTVALLMLSKYYAVCLNYAHCRNVVGVSFIPGCEQPWNYWRQSPREGLQLDWQFFFVFSPIQWPVSSTTKNCGITYMQHFNRKRNISIVEPGQQLSWTAYVTSTQSTAQGATSEQAGTMAEATEGLELTEARKL